MGLLVLASAGRVAALASMGSDAPLHLAMLRLGRQGLSHLVGKQQPVASASMAPQPDQQQQHQGQQDRQSCRQGLTEAQAQQQQQQQQQQRSIATTWDGEQRQLLLDPAQHPSSLLPLAP